MSAPRVPRPLLTAAEYGALPETLDGRDELVEGSVVMMPRPVMHHQEAMAALMIVLRRAAPARWMVLPSVDVDLELVPATEPGFVRNPDVVVLERTAFERVGRTKSLLRASEVGLVVEIISPGTRRIDRLVKHREYADAGIPNYWIIDIEGRPTLTECHIAGEFGHADAAPVMGSFTARNPFPVTLDLDKLV